MTWFDSLLGDKEYASIHAIEDAEDLAEAMRADVAVLYKHSPVCAVSRVAVREVRRFAEAHGEVPIFIMDVVRQRELAQRIADQLGVPHQSPQVIVLRRGVPRYDTSHRGVEAETLAEWIGSLD